ncbi:MAG: hypothetical protein AB9866_19795 [Syntrophobacteraceae bacterium]
MGLLNMLTKRSRGAKVSLIRELAKRRIQVGSQCNIPDEARNIDDLPESLVMLLPEARIAAIVENYIRLNSRGLSDETIFRELEAQWPLPAWAEELPRRLTLERYLKHRLSLEYTNIVMSSEYIEDAMIESVAFCLSEKSRASYLQRSLAGAERCC